MKDYQRGLRMQLCQLERQRAFLPSVLAAQPGSVLMTVLDAVLEESEQVRRRIGLLDLAPKRLRSRNFSHSVLPTIPIKTETSTEFSDEAGEWTLPSQEQI